MCIRDSTSFDLEPLVYKSLKKKLPELRDAIDGYITPEQAGKLKVIKACLLYTSYILRNRS